MKQKQGEGFGKVPQLGYRNRSEFIMEGIRQRIIDLKKAEIFKGEANR
jgi:metal-responsive CopG/Arc/MetJ family transcriptional regulator